MGKIPKIFLGLMVGGTLLVSSISGLVVDVMGKTPDFSELRSSVEVTIHLPNGEKTTRRIGPKTRGWVPIDEISNHLLMAVIASEDTSFFSHEGIDYHEVREAIRKDLKEKRWARGASTITQQVIKNVYLTREKTLWRKFKEIIWAYELDKKLAKSEILCFYVNLVEWGPAIYGIKAASRHYFDKEPSGLTVKESAFLAMLLPSPVKYHAYFEKKQLSPWATKRTQQILNVMLKMKFIDEDSYQFAQTEKLWGIDSGESAAGESGSMESEKDADLPGPENNDIPQTEPGAGVSTPAAPTSQSE